MAARVPGDALQAILAAAGAGGLAMLAVPGARAAWLPAAAAMGLAAWALERTAWAPRARPWVALGYLPGVLLYAIPLLARAAPPPWPRDLTALVQRYAAAIPCHAAWTLALAARLVLLRPRLPDAGPHRPWMRAGALAGGAALVFGILACLACRSFHKYVDLANDHELVLRLSRGEGPVCYLPTLYPSYPQSAVYWAQHFSVIYAAVARLYPLWPGPYLLLAVHAALVCATALPLFGALRPRIGDRQALGLAAAFLLHPTVQHALLWDAHALSMAAPFVVAAWWAVRCGRWGYFAAAALAALSCREDVTFATAGIGLALLLERGRRLPGAVVLAASGVLFVLLVNHLMPSLDAASSGSRDWRAPRFASLGTTHEGIVRALFAHPLRALGLYLQPGKLASAAVFLLPLAGLPLLGGRTALAALPLFAALFLSDGPSNYGFLLYYTMPALPFLFLGTGEALLRLERWGGRSLRDAAWLTVLGASLAASFAFGPSPLGRTFWDRGWLLGDFAEPYHHRSAYAQTAHAARGRALLERIPRDSVICAQNFFLPHLADALLLKNLPDADGADLVLLDPSHPNRYDLGDGYDAFVLRMRRDPGWRVLLEEDGYLLFGCLHGKMTGLP